MPRLPFSLVILTLVLALSGCGGPGYEIADLSGQVTVDGAPVETGTIIFTPLDGNRGPGVTVPIAAGRYQAAGVPRGRVRVDFNATRETGKMVDFFGKPTPEIENVIPKQYHAGLQIEVAGENGTRDFKLTSKP
jgi:hypothetical protein